MADQAAAENGEVDAVNHGGGMWLSIVFNHGVDNSAQLLVSGTSWIHHASSMAGASTSEVDRCAMDSSHQLQSMDEATTLIRWMRHSHRWMKRCVMDSYLEADTRGKRIYARCAMVRRMGVYGVGFDSWSGSWGSNRTIVTD
jgi:hypothetical protein